MNWEKMKVVEEKRDSAVWIQGRLELVDIRSKVVGDGEWGLSPMYMCTSQLHSTDCEFDPLLPFPQPRPPNQWSHRWEAWQSCLVWLLSLSLRHTSHPPVSAYSPAETGEESATYSDWHTCLEATSRLKSICNVALIQLPWQPCLSRTETISTWLPWWWVIRMSHSQEVY